MTGGTETNPDDAPMRPPHPADRPWAHPSEVGLATRGEAAKRRSSLIATGVVLGGLGLLLSGVMLGATGGAGPESATSAPTRRIEASLASVVAVHDDERRVVSGVLLDHDGHVLVPATGLDEADEIWARCGDGELVQVDRVTSVPEHGISVLRVDPSSGTPVDTRPPAADQASEVVLAHATEHAAVTERGTVSAGSARSATVRLAGSADPVEGERFVFDDEGHLLGVTTAAGPGFRAAAPMVDAARESIDARN